MTKILSQLKQIPLLLRLVVILFFLVGIFVPLITLVPGIGLTIEIEENIHLTWSDLLKTGLVFALMAYGPIHLAISYGVLKKTSWVRPVLVCLPFVQLLPFEIVEHVFGTHGYKLTLYQYFPITLGFAIFLVIYMGMAGGYLFFNKSVRAYFNQTYL